MPYFSIMFRYTRRPTRASNILCLQAFKRERYKYQSNHKVWADLHQPRIPLPHREWNLHCPHHWRLHVPLDHSQWKHWLQHTANGGGKSDGVIVRSLSRGCRLQFSNGHHPSEQRCPCLDSNLWVLRVCLWGRE